MELLNHIKEHSNPDFGNYGHLYFIRFLVIFWFLILPCIFGILLLFFKEMNKSKKTVILFKPLKPLMFYSYVFHNFLFFIVFLSLTFNFCFFMYTLVDVYLLELNDLYAGVWHIQAGEGQEPKEESFFFGIICVGLGLHLLSSLPYIYFNLYETDSYFGEAGRGYLHERNKNSEILKFLKVKAPFLYKGLHTGFLDVKVNTPEIDKKNMVVIDTYEPGV